MRVEIWPTQSGFIRAALGPRLEWILPKTAIDAMDELDEMCGISGDDAPVDTRSDSVKESIDPENFTPSSPFTRLGEFRLLSGKSGYPYSQFFVDNPANAIEECKTACKDDSNCPGFSLDWHMGVDKVNCMVFKSNTGEAEAQSCVYKPFGVNCRSGVKGKSGVTEGGMWWRGTRISQ